MGAQNPSRKKIHAKARVKNTMWYSNPESLTPRYFEIKEDPLVGFYLYVFEGNKCIYDHLQDTLEIAVECAWEDYGVPKTSWKEIKNNTIE